MKPLILVLVVLCLAGCKMSSFYPVLGATGGATIGSIGGPVGSGGGALVGYGVGKGAQLLDENKDLQETVELLSEGDVESIAQKALEKGMQGQASKFEDFVKGIQKILIVAGILLALYLAIPILVARKCAKKESERHATRAPFPTRTTGTSRQGEGKE